MVIAIIYFKVQEQKLNSNIWLKLNKDRNKLVLEDNKIHSNNEFIKFKNETKRRWGLNVNESKFKIKQMGSN